jgi:endonuclease/exonuclease/phosphatase family metal-dependent hydrolase
MTTHLEYYSASQRLAQAHALRALHDEQCAMTAAPPEPSDDGSPFQSKAHTAHAVLCGDFNAVASDAAIAAITSPASNTAHAFRDAWPLTHGSTGHAPTFRVFDRTYGPEPMACDFLFISTGLAARVRRVEVDGRTQASDHQPVYLEMG